MEYPYRSPQFRFDPFGGDRQALIRIGLWMRLGLVGASAFAIGFIMLINGDARPVTALATAIAGGLVAVFAWRRSWNLLSRIDPGAQVVAAPVVPVEGKDQPVAALRSPREIAADWAAG